MKSSYVQPVRQVFVPDGVRPIWDIPVFEAKRKRFALLVLGHEEFVGLSPVMGHRLAHATWPEINWTGTGHWIYTFPISYLGVIASLQTQGKNWHDLYSQWESLTPAGLISWFNLKRKGCPVAIEPDGTIVYHLSDGVRQLRWKDNGNARHSYPGAEGKLEAVLSKAAKPGDLSNYFGSRKLLMELVADLGFPAEMLEPILI